MAEIAAQLVSVERPLWVGTATSVTAQTTEGEIGVLPGHEPLLGQLVENGVVTIRTNTGEKLVAAVQGGFCPCPPRRSPFWRILHRGPARSTLRMPSPASSLQRLSTTRPSQSPSCAL